MIMENSDIFSRITSFYKDKIFKNYLLKSLFSVKTGQFFINPDGSKREKCRNNGKYSVFIIPFVNFSHRRKKQKIKCEKQPVKIPDNDDVDCRKDAFFI